jgi:hypothetical protein
MFKFPHTANPINHDVPGKEYVLQYTKRGYRCISWSPHNIMTEWVKTKEQALLNADTAIENFYKTHCSCPPRKWYNPIAKGICVICEKPR